ncbi:hypothetical protein E2C01_058978 [Portunus trituberculatus]|uniref:Uncharacterized protein n=1 Tax=Portunus trituberculatus TaxID=210409 RepID=A0A5B7H4M0_PORTR|nr:hypothetical protein [Portunus trituberculatus]
MFARSHAHYFIHYATASRCQEPITPSRYPRRASVYSVVKVINGKGVAADVASLDGVSLSLGGVWRPPEDCPEFCRDQVVGGACEARGRRDVQDRVTRLKTQDMCQAELSQSSI